MGALPIERRNGSEIAIIGMSCRFPGAANVEEYWRNVRDGTDCISSWSNAELEEAGVDPVLLKDPHYVKARGVLDGAELFDAFFFGATPREAEAMDPQQRVLLECAWEALESAGYDSNRFHNPIAVYAGVGMNSYYVKNLLSRSDVTRLIGDFQLMLGNDKDFAATRVSYKLNLRGPSITVQTACSTSLVAVCHACQSLLAGESDIALAGACSLTVPQKEGYLYQKGGIVSPDGHCRPFDASAQGTVFSNGAGVVVLKRLEDALADRDCIHAVIKGTAVNNDGSLKAGYTAPSVDGQAKVIRTAQAMAEVHPDTITYVETHGTATSLGDPIEIAGLTKAFRARTAKKGFCAIGSVKANIGHTDTAAGIAGLIKTVLMLKHRTIPPSLHFEQANPEIDFANSPFYVSAKLSPWATDGHPRRAGVSAFGIGGTNAHIILEEAPEPEGADRSRPWKLLVLSAPTASRLKTASSALSEHLVRHPGQDLADTAYTLQTGRREFEHRRIAVCRDHADAAALLAADPGAACAAVQQVPRDIAFLFSGQGAQYVHMGRDLYRTETVFRENIDRCSEMLQPHLSLDLRSILYPAELSDAEAAAMLMQTRLTQPALFAIEYALAQVWLSWGIEPAALAGHSIGEYVAACIAGVISLPDALALVAARGRLMQGLPAGTMLAVHLPETSVQPLLGAHLSLAVVNSPSLCVVSGETKAVEDLKKQLSGRNVACRALHTSHAFHSQMMDPIMNEFTEIVGRVRLQAPRIPFVSNVSGTWISASEAVSPEYWARHLRHTVRFSDCIGELLKTPHRVFLEVGPGNACCTFVAQHPARTQDHPVLSSLRRAAEERADDALLLQTLGRLWMAGAAVNWTNYYRGERRSRVTLPTSPFERQRHWIDPGRPQRVCLQSADGAGHEAVSGRASTLHAPETGRNDERSLTEDSVEQKIRGLWQDILGIDRIGADDRFFDLGGNSLSALRMFSQLETYFGKKIPLSRFKDPSLRQLAGFILNGDAVAETPSAAVVRPPLSSPEQSPDTSLHIRV